MRMIIITATVRTIGHRRLGPMSSGFGPSRNHSPSSRAIANRGSPSRYGQTRRCPKLDVAVGQAVRSHLSFVSSAPAMRSTPSLPRRPSVVSNSQALPVQRHPPLAGCSSRHEHTDRARRSLSSGKPDTRSEQVRRTFGSLTPSAFVGAKEPGSAGVVVISIDEVLELRIRFRFETMADR